MLQVSKPATVCATVSAYSCTLPASTQKSSCQAFKSRTVQHTMKIVSRFVSANKVNKWVYVLGLLWQRVKRKLL